MSIAADKARIEEAKAAIAAAIAGKGVDVPEGTKIDAMAALIASIEAGGAKVATGTITPATSVGSSVKIPHNLGVIPNVFLWFVVDILNHETQLSAYDGKIIKSSSTYNDTFCGGLIAEQSFFVRTETLNAYRNNSYILFEDNTVGGGSYDGTKVFIADKQYISSQVNSMPNNMVGETIKWFAAAM